MIKKICFLVVAFVFAVLANQDPERAEAEGGTDHIYFNGKECRIVTHPLNEFIAKHYAEWPFRPSSARPAYGNPPLYTYFIPKNGGGYLAYWSIRDSSLYLDSVTINSKLRVVPLIRNIHYLKGKDNTIVSVSIPPQEIVLNTSAEKRTVKNQKSEPLFADFVSDTIEFSCGWSRVYSGWPQIYKSVVREGKVISLPKELSYGEETHSKNSDESPIPKPYREFSSPFENYYKILDSLRIAIDVMNSEDRLAQLRKDPRFKWFEKLFNINAVDFDRGHPIYASDEGRSFYVTPKGNTPFKEILLGLKHNENPIEAVKLFLRTIMVMQKNPSFEKWLRYKIPLMNYYQVYLEKRDSLFVLWESIDIDTLWKDVGMKGEYVGTLSFFNWGTHQYEFILSDNGDVLVTWAFVPENENFYNIASDNTDPFFAMQGIKLVARMKPCNHPNFNIKITEANKNALFLDYLIIRNDGTIEYGPKSGDM